MRLITNEERRARLARRHAIAPEHRVDTAEAATEAMTVLHSTEPASVHLAIAARTKGVQVADVERALYDDRTLVKQLAMRRTLFVFPRDLLPAAWGSASARVAAIEFAKTAKDAERSAVAPDGAVWVEAARQAVLRELASGTPTSTKDLRALLPELEGRTQGDPTKKWDISTPLAPRILTILGSQGHAVRGPNDGHWRTSRPRWTSTETWLGTTPTRTTQSDGYAELVRRWLWTFGPGTEIDIAWWLGATKGATRQALADVGAVDVRLEDGQTGYLHPEDTEATDPTQPWAALLPVLDPTTMGWKQRDFYLKPELVPYLFDSNGNGGSTAWWNGQIVGCWVQDDDARVRVLLREKLSRQAREALDTEAERLTDWLGGTVIASVYKSALMKGQTLP